LVQVSLVLLVLALLVNLPHLLRKLVCVLAQQPHYLLLLALHPHPPLLVCVLVLALMLVCVPVLALLLVCVPVMDLLLQRMVCEEHF